MIICWIPDNKLLTYKKIETDIRGIVCLKNGEVIFFNKHKYLCYSPIFSGINKIKYYTNKISDAKEIVAVTQLGDLILVAYDGKISAWDIHSGCIYDIYEYCGRLEGMAIMPECKQLILAYRCCKKIQLVIIPYEIKCNKIKLSDTSTSLEYDFPHLVNIFYKPNELIVLSKCDSYTLKWFGKFRGFANKLEKRYHFDRKLTAGCISGNVQIYAHKAHDYNKFSYTIKIE